MRFSGAVLALFLGTAACSRTPPPAADDGKPKAGLRIEVPVASAANAVAVASAVVKEKTLPAEQKTWRYETTSVGPMSVVVLLPERRENERFPVLIALHGLGEALKGPERGARGWVDDYGLLEAAKRLEKPSLTPDDLGGFVTSERLERLNRSLREQPFRGLIVACPYTPPALRGDRPFAKAQPLASFVVDELLPRIYRETPALGSEATGIDGVSLGGRAAVTVGLLRPEAFGAVAALQAAFDVEDAPEIAARARRARERNPALKLRFLTSEGDYFLRANRAIGSALERAGLERELLVVPGPHDYEFNRGPGAIEMLVYHDRVLRGRPAP